MGRCCWHLWQRSVWNLDCCGSYQDNLPDVACMDARRPHCWGDLHVFHASSRMVANLSVARATARRS